MVKLSKNILLLLAFVCLVGYEMPYVRADGSEEEGGDEEGEGEATEEGGEATEGEATEEATTEGEGEQVATAVSSSPSAGQLLSGAGSRKSGLSDVGLDSQKGSQKGMSAGKTAAIVTGVVGLLLTALVGVGLMRGGVSGESLGTRAKRMIGKYSGDEAYQQLGELEDKLEGDASSEEYKKSLENIRKMKAKDVMNKIYAAKEEEREGIRTALADDIEQVKEHLSDGFKKDILKMEPAVTA